MAGMYCQWCGLYLSNGQCLHYVFDVPRKR